MDAYIILNGIALFFSNWFAISTNSIKSFKWFLKERKLTEDFEWRKFFFTSYYRASSQKYWTMEKLGI